jgi:predicted RNA binding protein YcfA (HicA-like mRNA interferase family)
MAMKNRGEMMKLVKRAEKQGFDVRRTGSGHWKVTSPDGKGMTVLSFSPKTGGTRQSVKQLTAIGFRDE